MGDRSRDDDDGQGPGDDGGQGVTVAELARLIDAAPAGRLLRGSFAVYKTGDGGLHVSYRADGAEEDGHLPIPARIIGLALAAGAGRGPLRLLGRIM